MCRRCISREGGEGRRQARAARGGLSRRATRHARRALEIASQGHGSAAISRDPSPRATKDTY